jgi:hypothetical protein
MTESDAARQARDLTSRNYKPVRSIRFETSCCNKKLSSNPAMFTGEIPSRNSGVPCMEAGAIEDARNDVPRAADGTGARRRPIHSGSI